MRALALAVTTALLFALAACDQLNKPMPVSSFGTSASSSGAAAAADAGTDDAATPGDVPVVTPQPGDVQL